VGSFKPADLVESTITSHVEGSRLTAKGPFDPTPQRAQGPRPNVR
jgi:hypothetical protein